MQRERERETRDSSVNPVTSVTDRDAQGRHSLRAVYPKNIQGRGGREYSPVNISSILFSVKFVGY